MRTNEDIILLYFSATAAVGALEQEAILQEYAVTGEGEMTEGRLHKLHGLYAHLRFLELDDEYVYAQTEANYLIVLSHSFPAHVSPLRVVFRTANIEGLIFHAPSHLFLSTDIFGNAEVRNHFEPAGTRMACSFYAREDEFEVMFSTFALEGEQEQVLAYILDLREP